MAVFKRRTTRLGRVVYDRKKHEFTVRDAARVAGSVRGEFAYLLRAGQLLFESLRIMGESVANIFFLSGEEAAAVRTSITTIIEFLRDAVVRLAEPSSPLAKSVAIQLRALADYLDPRIK